VAAGLAAALAVLATAAVSGRASARIAEPHERGSLTAALVRAAAMAQAIELEPGSWFPVRGVIDFGAADARFGALRAGHVHAGQDVFAEPGTPVVSVREGVVVERGDDGGRGNYVAIWSPETDRTFVYLHMLRPAGAGEAEHVAAGGRIGAVGCTGSCWGDHLHLELRRGRGTAGEPLDPLPLLARLALRAR
jgi:murein DD-endopeptidase MepM/ murein hydrolase activator NlpD